jgi:hypothetical protein
MIPTLIWKTCLGAIVLFLGLFWLYSFILGKAFADETRFIGAFIATILMLLSITNLLGIWTNLMDLSALKRSDELPGFQDGKRVAACGRIYPLSNQPVKSPFSRKDCVAYSYKVEFRGDELSETDFAGKRLIPSAIKTPKGDVRLLSWPSFKGFGSPIVDEITPDRNVYQNLAEYICSTTFEVTDAAESNVRTGVKTIFRTLKVFLTDDDGDIRREIANSSGCDRAKITRESGRDLATFDAKDSPFIVNHLRSRSLEETCVGSGEEVCLIGIWSAAKRGIVSNATKGIMPVLIRGSRIEFEQNLRSATTKRLIWGLVLGCVANLGVWLVVTFT